MTLKNSWRGARWHGKVGEHLAIVVRNQKRRILWSKTKKIFWNEKILLKSSFITAQWNTVACHCTNEKSWERAQCHQDDPYPWWLCPFHAVIYFYWLRGIQTVVCATFENLPQYLITYETWSEMIDIIISSYCDTDKGPHIFRQAAQKRRV